MSPGILRDSVIRVLLLLALAVNLSSEVVCAWAQQSAPVPIVGVLLLFWGPEDEFVPSVRKGLEDFGYADGRNIKIEYRSAQAQLDQLPRLAGDLVGLGARVIVVGTAAAARAVKQASSTVPIVFALYDYDPVATGLIESFSHPGGTITGIFSRHSELVGKRLELLKEALPKVSRVAVFWDSSSRLQFQDLQRAAHVLRVQLEPIELHDPYDFTAAFRAARKTRAGALMVLFSPAFVQQRTKIAKLAVENKLPTIYQDTVEVTAGGLISYGPSSSQLLQRTAYYIDRLLKGEKAADLPVEQSSQFRLFVNLKTAKAIGITIPESILLRADEVIR